MAQQIARNILTLEGGGGRQLDGWKLWKIVGGGVADMYGSGSCDNGGVCATAPFGPRSVIDRDVVSAKAGQGQGQD